MGQRGHGKWRGLYVFVHHRIVSAVRRVERQFL